jgi:hypothetical protein
MTSAIKTAQAWVIGGAIIALILVIVLILFGNLSGNLGFAAGTQGANDTNAVINNFTAMARNTASQLPTVGTFIGLGLLIGALLVILIGAIVAFKKMGGGAGRGSFGE